MRAFFSLLILSALLLSSVSADSDEGACGCISARSTKWRTVTDDEGLVSLDNDEEFGECLEEILPVNACNGDAECEKELEGAYKFHREVLTFSEDGDTYETYQEWDLQCSDKIFDDDNDRVRMYWKQLGDWENVQNSDDSEDSFQCRMTFKPTGARDDDDDDDTCEGWFKTGSSDGNGNKMCNQCSSSCGRCDGDWQCFNNSCSCEDEDDRLFIAPQPCPRGCKVFGLDETITRVFEVNNNCDRMTTEWYGKEFLYIPGSASALSSSFALMFILLLLSVLF